LPSAVAPAARRRGGLDAPLLDEVLAEHVLDPPSRVMHTRMIHRT